MLVEIRIYFEGDKSLKPGFSAFLSEARARAREKRCRFELIATGGTPTRDFGIAIKSNRNAWNILLLDSEGPYTGNRSALLCTENGWTIAHADSIFWMVQMMEAWFHADKDAFLSFMEEDLMEVRSRRIPMSRRFRR